MQEPETISLKKELQQLPQGIRLVCRTGFYQTDEKQRDKIVRAFQQYNKVKDFAQLTKTVPNGIFVREVLRLLGEIEFDLLIYSGEDDTFLRLFCQAARAKQKIVIGDAAVLGCEAKREKPEERLKWENVAAANQYFDKVYWINPKAREYAQKNGMLGQKDGGLLCIPFYKDCTKLLNVQQELDDIVLEKKKYSIITCGNGKFVFIPQFKRDELNFAVVVQKEYLVYYPKLLDVWQTSKEPKGTLYLLDPDNLLEDELKGMDVKKEAICYIHGRKLSATLLSNCSHFIICGSKDRLVPYAGFFEKRILDFDASQMEWKEGALPQDDNDKQALPFALKELPGKQISRLWNGKLEFE